jgi:hypothetical protein
MLSDRELTALFTSAQVDEAPDPTFLDELFALLVEEVAAVRPDRAPRRARAGVWAPTLPVPRAWRWSLLVAAGVIVAIVGLGLVLRQPGNVGAPSPSPSGSPVSTTVPSPTPAQRVTPSATRVPFTSSAYGYSLSYPANWKTRPSVGTLARITYPYDFDPAVDYFSVTAPDVGDPGLIVAGPLVTAATTLTSWAAAIQSLQANTAICPPATSAENVQIGGQPGRLLTWVACPAYLLWAGVVHGGRAYHVILIDQFAVNDGALEAADRALFLRILASFKFTAGPSPSAT